MVAPAGVSERMETQRPKNAQITENVPEQITTDLKFLNRRMAERAGKIISAVIKREPTSLMARTITTAVTVAMSKL